MKNTIHLPWRALSSWKISIGVLIFLGLVTTVLFQNCGKFGSQSGELASQEAVTATGTLQPGDPTTEGRVALSTEWLFGAWQGRSKISLYFDRLEDNSEDSPTLNVDINQDANQTIKIQEAGFADYLTHAPQRVLLSTPVNEFDLLFLSTDLKSVLAVQVVANALAVRWEIPLAVAVSTDDFKSVSTGNDGLGATLKIGQNQISKAASNDPTVAAVAVDGCLATQHLEDNKCVANQRACSITNGSGLQVWQGFAWDACEPVSCAVGFNKVGAECKAIQIVMSKGTSSYTSALNWQTVHAANAAFHLGRVTQLSLVSEKLADKLAKHPVLVSFNAVDPDQPNAPTPEQISAASEGLHDLMTVSFCARYAIAAADAAKCTASAIAYIKRWTAASIPSGNPVADGRYRLLIMAMDLLMPMMAEADVAKSKAWLLSVINNNTAYMEKLASTDGRRKNSWTAWRIMTRAFIGEMLGSASTNADTLTLLKKFIADQFVAPTGWKPSDPTPTIGNASCQNTDSINEPTYGSQSFRSHDSLHAHLYTLEAMIYMRALTDVQGLSAAEIGHINRAHDLFKNYVLGTKQHMDWKCTSYQNDIDRRVANDPIYAIAPFDPKSHRVPLRIGRIVYPASQVWTTSFLTVDYSAWTKFWMALRGDVGP